jgi:DNA-binding transcriptional regulator YiaG
LEARASPGSGGFQECFEDLVVLRGLTGLSQAKFAELLGIELATMRNWEQGRRDPAGPAHALLRAIKRTPLASSGR